MAAIEVSGLVKTYDGVVAVDGVDLTVEPGEVLALLGPNGAGKTTTVEILEGHRRRDGGTVRVLGYDPEQGDRAFRERIGIVLQEGGLEETLTVREALEIYGAAYPRRLDADRLVELVELGDKADARIRTLSGGQRRRLDLALALVGDPELVFLDEPTTGFDPSARRRAWDTLEALASMGKTILLTTHYMEEANRLAHRIVMMAHGRVVAEGSPDELRRRYGSRTAIRFRAVDGIPVEAARLEGDRVVVETDRPTETLHRLTSWATERGIELQDLEVHRPGLEDIYLELTR
ncbi:MAG: ABC transporter [Acidimicrobiia bacterium]|nr:MAG: ABC transporter [Acidimicrobiia bacterium]